MQDRLDRGKAADVSEYEPTTTPSDDAPTQQLRRIVPPGRSPGPLDLTHPGPPAGRSPADSTDVLSLDELMDGATAQTPAVAAPRRAPMPVVPVRSEPMPADPVQPPLQPPVQPEAAPRPASRVGPVARDVRDRLRSDASAALSGAGRYADDWLRTGDNGLILATVVVALLLLVAVASF